nr:MAG TPA: hypothetical protein [Caudoviricetes sp.]
MYLSNMCSGSPIGRYESVDLLYFTKFKGPSFDNLSNS